MDTAARRIELVYPVPETDPRWVLEDDETVPESALHDAILLLLVEILDAWTDRQDRPIHIGRNLALRWDHTRPKVGVDPDVVLIDPAPPGGTAGFKSLRTWVRGHHPPRVAVEVVSERTALKDYTDGPERYAASATRELWVFDPERHGPAIHGGPWLLQVWRRDGDGRFTRVYTGDGPARSEELGAWLLVIDERLRIADDAAGKQLWPTRAERERAEKEAALAREAHERTEKDAALAELARLRALLAARRDP